MRNVITKSTMIGKLFSAVIAIVLSSQVYAQANISLEDIPIGSYAVPYGATSGQWLIVETGYLTSILDSYNDGSQVDWEGALLEIETLPQVGAVASLTNLLSNYIPTDSDYECLGGPMLCCRTLGPPPEGECICCWSYDCSNCSCDTNLYGEVVNAPCF